MRARGKGRLLVLAVAGMLVACASGGKGTSCSLEGGAALLSPDIPGVWPKFRRDLRNTGRSPVQLGENAGPGEDSWAGCGEPESRCAWRSATGGPVASSPVIDADGSVYAGSGDGRIYGLSAGGEPKWDAVVTGDAITASPLVDANGLVIVPSGDGTLYAVAGESGELVWTVPLIGFLAASPTIDQAPAALGVVYVGSLSGSLFAVCPNGVARWAVSMGAVTGTPAIADEETILAVAGGDGRALTAIVSETGEVRWRFAAGAPIMASPAVADDGAIYVAGGDGKVFALAADGVQKAGFAYNTGAAVSASPAIGNDGTVYIGDEAGVMTALDPHTGVPRWVFDAGAAIRSSPAVTADRTIFFGTDDGSVYALTDLGDSAAVRWHFVAGDKVRSSPALGSEGTVYVGSEDGFLYALRP